MMTPEEERRLTLLEMQVGSLIKQRDDLIVSVRKLREFITANCPHSALDSPCPTCRFLQEDAK
jgi:hypothetical protein